VHTFCIKFVFFHIFTLYNFFIINRNFQTTKRIKKTRQLMMTAKNTIADSDVGTSREKRLLSGKRRLHANLSRASYAKIVNESRWELTL